MIDEHLAVIAQEVHRLKFDYDMAKVRGYDFVATLYRGQMEQLYEPLQELVDELWRSFGAVRWHIDPADYPNRW